MASMYEVYWDDNASTSSSSNSHYHASEYRFSTINKAHKIPPYSKILTCSVVVTGNRTKPTSGTAIGQLWLYLGTDGNDNDITLTHKGGIDWDSDPGGASRTIYWDCLGQYDENDVYRVLVNSENSKSGNLELGNKAGFVVEVNHVYYLGSQTLTSEMSIHWIYEIPYIKATTSIQEGQGTVAGAGEYDYDKSYTISATPAEGYEFVSWSDGNKDQFRTIPATDISNISAFETVREYKAIFKQKTYTVTWKNEDGTILKTENLVHGTIPSYTGTPSKEKTLKYTYVFNGWDKSFEAIITDTTYTATYTEVLRPYTVKAQNIICSFSGTGTYYYGDTVSLKMESIEEGYQFKNWVLQGKYHFIPYYENPIIFILNDELLSEVNENDELIFICDVEEVTKNNLVDNKKILSIFVNNTKLKSILIDYNKIY